MWYILLQMNVIQITVSSVLINYLQEELKKHLKNYSISEEIIAYLNISHFEFQYFM